jgi:hypothetical protein
VKTIYYVNLKRPWRQILVIECEIVQCEKFTWAVDCRGVKRLLGASAFFTLASAERAKVGALEKTAHPAVATKAPHAYEAARAELRKYRSTAMDTFMQQINGSLAFDIKNVAAQVNAALAKSQQTFGF